MQDTVRDRPLVLAGIGGAGEHLLGRITQESETGYGIQVVRHEDQGAFKEGFAGYLFEYETLPPAIRSYLEVTEKPYLYGVDNIGTLLQNDVVALDGLSKSLRVIFRTDTQDNALVLTNECNCNCIMCPDPATVRRSEIRPHIEQLREAIRLLPPSTKFLTLTGGEPTLLRDGLLVLLSDLKSQFPNLNIQVLTNGRMFAYRDFSEKYVSAAPKNLVTAISLQSHLPAVHDRITRCEGSFDQTVLGIHNLLSMQHPVELRLVVTRLNFDGLLDTCTFIASRFKGIVRLNIMGLELFGNASTYKQGVWVPFDEMAGSLRRAALYLTGHGVNIRFYNFPLCYMPESLWQLAEPSIAAHKADYPSLCEQCLARERCGGLFKSTLAALNLRVRPIC